MLFLRLPFRELARLDPQAAGLAEGFTRARRYVGDIGSAGKGEVLVRER